MVGEFKMGESSRRNEIVGKALSGVSYLASVQLSSRVFTFLLNVALTRYMQDPAALGVASIQLYLLYTLVLTLSRETVRRVCLRLASKKIKTWEVVNLIWWGVGFGFILTPFLCYYSILYVDEDARKGIPFADYEQSIWLIGLSIVFELLCEPLFVIAQGQLQYSSRSLFEAIAVIVRCVTTVFAAVAFQLHLVAFAWGYVFYSLTLLLSYWFMFRKQFAPLKDAAHSSEYELWRIYSFLETFPSHGGTVRSQELLSPAWSFFKQTILKLFLAEGEKLIMVAFAMEPADQAIYAVVFNLGSLVARFFFQPIEEVSYTVFGKLNDLAKEKSDKKGKDRSNEHGSSLSLGRLLRTLSKLMFIVGVVFAAFGPNYSHLLLHILYGEKYSSTTAPTALGFYCFYVMIIAINGITEAFVHAVADEKTLDIFNRWLVLCSMAFLFFSAVLLRFGAIGLICANSINMVLRILFSMQYILKWKDPNSETGKPEIQSVMELLPNTPVWFAFVLSFMTTRLSSTFFYQDFVSFSNIILHVTTGICALFIFTAVTYKSEHKLVRDLKEVWRMSRKKD